jgi:hypothetical protein
MYLDGDEKKGFGARRRQLEEFKASGMAVDHVDYVPNCPYSLKLVGRESMSHPNYNPQNAAGKDKEGEASDTLDRLLKDCGEVFQDSEYRHLLLAGKDKEKHDDECAKRTNITRLRLERKNAGKPITTRRNSNLAHIFGHMEELAEHQEQHQLEVEEDKAWQEAQERRRQKKEERLQASKRRRRAQNALGTSNAYTDDHYQSNPQQVDKEVSMANNVFKALGGRVLKVAGGTDPNSAYFQEMLERGKTLHDAGWVPRKDKLTMHVPGYYNPWTKEVRTREEHVRQQVCCDCKSSLAMFKQHYVFLAETKQSHEMMIDCGKIEGARRWFCVICYKKKKNHYKEPVPLIGKGALKWYNPFVEEKKYEYKPPQMSGQADVNDNPKYAQEHMYQRRRGKDEREAAVIANRMKKYMRGAGQQPDNFYRGAAHAEKKVSAKKPCREWPCTANRLSE